MMLDCLKGINFKKTGIFAAGVLFGTAGISYYQAKMQRNFIQMERQRCLEQKNVS